MAEQTFRSPGFFEQEIDISQRQQAPLGVPAGVIGTAAKGPAFVPVTVGSYADFKTKFGDLDPKKFGPYAVREFLKTRTAVTYLRVLGAGANDTTTDIELTRTHGTVLNAGFKITGSTVDAANLRHKGTVQFIVARHFVSASENVGFPVISDNDSLGTSSDNFVNLVRAMVLMPSGTRLMVLDASEAFTGSADDGATIDSNKKFKLVLSSSATGFATTDGHTGVKILTASLDPSSGDYIGNILNKDPERFIDEEHLLYADFSVENEIATVASESGSIAIVSGSSSTSTDSGDTSLLFRQAYGRFDTRFTTPRTPTIITQPFGSTEYDLFYFESLDDGVYANGKFKVSVTDLRMSSNPKYDYGSFTVVVRSYDDNDLAQEILERFPNCSLDPDSENYVARQVGDKKVYYNFDAESEDERRLIIKGKYPNRSTIMRIVMSDAVDKAEVPAKSLPFGFRGIEVLKTSDTLTDTASALGTVGASGLPRRLGMVTGSLGSSLSGSIVPPLPFRFKVTKGAVSTGGGFTGNPGSGEIVDGRFHWGVKFEKVPRESTVSNAIYNPNAGSAQNPLVEAYTRFLGIKKLDVLVTGSGADAFNNNKFTLARVAFPQSAVSDLTGSTRDHMKEVAYIRNGKVDPTSYTVSDGVLTTRITFATLAAQTSSADFNRFIEFAKYTMPFGGGFDGVNILDRDANRLNDRASSSDTGGGATTSFVSPGLLTNVNGTGKLNNTVYAYRAATKIMTDPYAVNVNILAIPGVRDSFVTDFAADAVRTYGMAIYLMDPVEYDESTNRLFDDDSIKPDVGKTSNQFEARAIDNNYVATYFPDVLIDDPVNNRRVLVPPSIAAISALGFNDKAAYPWFAPAGFNRNALSFVAGVDVRLNASDRDTLYDARINPIATFPKSGNTFPQGQFVIWGQKTLQQAHSALDRVNVRRLLLEVKRVVVNVARNFVFEQNNSTTRQAFVSQVTPLLALIQTQSGVESFRVIMDESNNTQTDIEANRLNGKIGIVPTRTAEFISIDFIVTNSGVSFE